jgi:uncharacterized protein (DUF58 family)
LDKPKAADSHPPFHNAPPHPFLSRSRSGLVNTSLPPVKIRLHSLLWPLLVAVLLFLQLGWPHRAWMTLLIILGGTWAIGLFWTLTLSRRLFLDREMRYGWAQVGDILEERFTVINDSNLPSLWLEVEDQSTLPDYTAGRVISIGANEEVEWRTSGVCSRRGLYTLGPTRIRSGDPMGIYSVEFNHPYSTVLLVLPPVLPLPDIEVAAGGRAGDGRRPRRTVLETTVSVDTVREYVPGDPLKNIHWPTSVRRNALYVRQFEHMPASDWWIIFDVQDQHQVGSGFDSTEEHGVILAASLADRGIRQGHNVGLIASGQPLSWIPPRRSPGQLMDILRTLAVVHPGERPVADVLVEAQRSIRRGASVILITANQQGDWAAPLLQLMKSGTVPTVMLFDPASFGGSEASAGVLGMMDKYDIAHSLIPREMLDRPEAHPGTQGKWEWRVVGRGKAVAVRKPSETGWRPLG